MSDHPYLPEDIDADWDVVVIGTGMGGSTLGHALAREGHRVLFIEKGNDLLRPGTRGDGGESIDTDESPRGRLRRGKWPLKLQGTTSFGKTSFFPPLGCGTGGSTGLYAAQLERMHASDFRPRANFPGVEGSTVPEAWPVGHDEMVPYYRAAEALYRVTGTQDPLAPDPESPLLPPPPLSPRDQDLFDSFLELGLNPYRAHAGFKFLDGCRGCGAALCPRGCKSDAATICLLPALENHNARLLTGCEALALEADQDHVTAVRCRMDEREFRVRGKRIVLAAGAYMSPLLLLNSSSRFWPDGLANRSGAVGRNLMLHTGDLMVVRARRSLSKDGPTKAIALNDFYFHEAQRLGTVQSIGVEIDWGRILYYLRNRVMEDPRWWRPLTKPFLRWAAYAAGYYYRSAALFTTIIEDLPYWDNRIVPDPNAVNNMRFEYRYSDELFQRNQKMRTLLKNILGPRHKVRIISGKNNINYGHVCGTCRFGDDPNTSVLDRENRAHGLSNLYIVDASFFPSSSGTNPSLTIAANALRVADAITRE